MSSLVTHTRAANSNDAQAHFDALLRFETDCSDVHHALHQNIQDFILFDVRGESAYQKAHLPNAISLPHSQISTDSLSPYPHSSLFVVYCAGPHCNGADKAASQLAQLGRPVKKMLGGISGWMDEGFTLTVENPWWYRWLRI